MKWHLTDHRSGFPQGLTEVTRFDDGEDPTRISFAVLKMASGESLSIDAQHETAWMLMKGRIEATDESFWFGQTADIVIRVQAAIRPLAGPSMPMSGRRVASVRRRGRRGKDPRSRLVVGVEGPSSPSFLLLKAHEK